MSDQWNEKDVFQMSPETELHKLENIGPIKLEIFNKAGLIRADDILHGDFFFGWSPSTPLGTGGTAFDLFGWSVSVSGDGATAVVGAYGVSSNTGAAYVFTKTSGVWSSSTTLQASGGATGDYFGVSVSVSGAGTTALVGAYGVSSFTGAAYSFLFA